VASTVIARDQSTEQPYRLEIEKIYRGYKRVLDDYGEAGSGGRQLY